jgi:ATP-binding protein involved in chromosome partitioning
MRYAVPVTNGRLATHFGHCEQFALFDVDEATKEIKGRNMIDPPEHQPGVLPVFLADAGVSAVIAGGMGSRAQDLFIQNRIQVILGASEIDPEQVVLDYLNGKLVTGDNICDH